MNACGVVAALLLAAVAVLITADVVLRNLGLGTLPWILELSEYSLPAATFLSAPWLLYRNEHIRIELLTTALSRRGARRLDRAINALGLVICAIVLHYGLAAIADSRRIGSLVIKTLVFPEWWLFAPLPFACLLLAAEFLRRIIVAPRPEGR